MKNKIYLLAVFSLYLLSARAQHITFNLPFMNESAEPELYIFEPNYNKEGNIDYYSLADIMKVQYTYNDQRRPVRKILSVRDKFDSKWKQVSITDFIYQNDRLVSEQITQLYNGITPVYKLSKTITYDPVSHTDTIRTDLEWMDTRFEDQMNVFLDETYTIRYLNQYNLPDSAIKIYSSEDVDYTMKQNYVYDKKQQLVSCLFYNKYTDSNQSTSWMKVSEYNVTYNKNQIEYSQTTTVLDIYEGETWEATDPNDYENQLKEIRLKYTLSTNNDGRIVSKQLVSEDQVIMDSQYTYNKEGQMDVTQQFNLSDRFLRFYGMSGLRIGGLSGIIKEIRNLSYTIKNHGNCKQSAFYADKKKMMEINTCIYPENRLQYIEMIRYNDGKIDDHDKVEYNYLANGFIERIEYSDYDEGLEPLRKYLYKEDTEGRVLYQEKFFYDNDSKQWQAREKEINKYDKYGYTCYNETYEYRQGDDDYYGENKAGGWEGKKWKEYVYDAKKRVLGEKTKKWRNGQWINDSFQQAIYDDKDRNILDATYEWDGEDKRWSGVRKDSIFFDDAISMTCKIRFEWDKNQKNWMPYRKTETEIEDNEDIRNDPRSLEYNYKEKMSSYYWNDGTWEPHIQQVHKKGRGRSFYSYSSRIEEKQNLVTRAKEIKETDKNGTEFYEKYDWDNELQELTGSENTITLYLDANHRDSKRIIYRVWDRTSQSWKDRIACNTFVLGNNEAYIYEKYDEKNNRWMYNRKVEMKEFTNDRMEINQYFWNEKTDNWEFDRRIISRYRNNRPFRFEVSVYERDKKKWMPLYCMVETTPGKETIYYKWSELQQNWVHYLAKKDSGWSEKGYVWNDQSNQFVEIEDYEFDALNSNINNEINRIDMRTKYQSVINNE